jgi:hypothetical protein
LTFERFADDLAEGLASNEPADAERSLLIEEVKIGCTLGMLSVPGFYQPKKRQLVIRVLRNFSTDPASLFAYDISLASRAEEEAD